MNKKYLSLIIALIGTVSLTAMFYACSGDGPSGTGTSGIGGLVPTTIIGSGG